jgi:hypothetical protein
VYTLPNGFVTLKDPVAVKLPEICMLPFAIVAAFKLTDPTG